MAEFRKTILKVGNFETRDGAFLATAERLQSFADKFAEMTQRGIRVPICWGHQPYAEPDDPDSDPNDPAVMSRREYLASRLNAGYLTALAFHPDRGELEAAGDVPGAKIDGEGNLLAWTQLADSDDKVLSAISEVSAGVRNWTDGRGREWQDVIIHLALVVLPVVEGQSGFEALSTGFDTGKPRVVYLSLSQQGQSLATPRDRSMNAAEIEKGQPKTEPSTADNKKTAMLDTPPPDEGGPPDAKGARYKELLNDLKECGIVVPDDTDPKQFLDHLRVAVANCLHNQANGDDDDDEPLEPEAALDTETEDDEDESENKVDKGNSKAVEEPRPILMGTETTSAGARTAKGKRGAAAPALLSTLAKTPLERALLAREESRARKDRITRLDRLVKRGMPVAEAEELKKAASGYQLSLLPSGKPAKQNIDLILETWEKALPKKGFPDEFLLSTATEEDRPEYASGAPTNDDVRGAAQARAAKMSRGNGSNGKA